MFLQLINWIITIWPQVTSYLALYLTKLRGQHLSQFR